MHQTRIWIDDMCEPDIDGLHPILSMSFDPHHGEGWRLADVRTVLGLDGVHAYCARSRNNPITGFVLMRQVLDEAELFLIAVLPSLWRCGIGSALLKHCLEQAMTLGIHSLFLEVRENNAQAIAFYLKFGFTILGRRKQYYRGSQGHLFDALTLQLNLLEYKLQGNSSASQKQLSSK